MRATVVEHLEGRRVVPYSPEDHSLLDRTGTLDVKVLEVAEGLLRLRLTFEFRIQTKPEGQLWGVISGSAVTTITSPLIAPDLFQRGGGVPETVAKLVDGAFCDDVLVPVTELARAMHLPGLLRGPVDFARLLQTPSRGRTLKDSRTPELESPTVLEDSSGEPVERESQP